MFINGEHVGGCDKTIEAHQNGRLQQLLNKSQSEQETSQTTYDYDLIVIGGGSGGLAASKVHICFVSQVLARFNRVFELFRKLRFWERKLLSATLSHPRRWARRGASEALA